MKLGDLSSVESPTQQPISHFHVKGGYGISMQLLPLLKMYFYTDTSFQKKKTNNASMASCESSKCSFLYRNPNSGRDQASNLIFKVVSYESSIRFIGPCRKVTYFLLCLQMDFAPIHVADGLVLESDT